MANMAEFLDWVGEDIGEPITLGGPNDNGMSIILDLPSGRATVTALAETPEREGSLELRFPAPAVNVDELALKGPLTRLTWHRILAAIVRHEIESEARGHEPAGFDPSSYDVLFDSAPLDPSSKTGDGQTFPAPETQQKHYLYHQDAWFESFSKTGG